MSAFIEVHVKGGGQALIDAGLISGVLCAPGCSITDHGTPDKPVRLLLRGGVELDVVGEFAGKILVRAHMARLEARRRKAETGIPEHEFYVDYLTPMGEPRGTDES